MKVSIVCLILLDIDPFEDHYEIFSEEQHTCTFMLFPTVNINNKTKTNQVKNTNKIEKQI